MLASAGDYVHSTDLRCSVVFPHPGGQLVVGYGAPVLGLSVGDWLQLQSGIGEGRRDGGEVSHGRRVRGPVTVRVVRHVAWGGGSEQVGLPAACVVIVRIEVGVCCVQVSQAPVTGV